MNRVIIVGRLGADPELRQLKGGESCTFSVATSEQWKDSAGEKQERTEWHQVVAYKKLAEICAKHLHKGSQVLVEGKLRTRSWEDSNGQKRYTTEIVAASVRFLDSKEKHQDDDEIEY